MYLLLSRLLHTFTVSISQKQKTANLEEVSDLSLRMAANSEQALASVGTSIIIILLKIVAHPTLIRFLLISQLHKVLATKKRYRDMSIDYEHALSSTVKQRGSLLAMWYRVSIKRQEEF